MEYAMFNNAKVLFADNIRMARQSAQAFELDPTEWAVLPLRGALLGWKIKKAVIIWPSREMTPREQKLHATWVSEHLAIKLPPDEKPIILY